MGAFTAFAMARIAAQGSRELPSPRPAGTVVRVIDVALQVDDFITQKINTDVIARNKVFAIPRPRLVIAGLRTVRGVLSEKSKTAPVDVTQIKQALATVFEFQANILELMLTPNDSLGNQILATYETISDVFTGIGRGIGDIASLIAFVVKFAPYAIAGYVGWKVLGGESVFGGKEKS